MYDLPEYFRLTCLTPVHIGMGVEYLSGIDLVCKAGKTFLLDSERVLKQLYATGQLPRDSNDLKVKIEALFQRAKIDDYALAQTTGEMPEGRKVRGAIRAGDGRLIVPGSSLKGALRTLMFAARVGTAGPHTAMRPEFAEQFAQAVAGVQARKRYPAQALERTVFRGQTRYCVGDPKGDLLRACSSSDAMFAADSTVVVLCTSVGTHKDTLVGVEALACGSSAGVALRVGDDYLASSLFTETLPSCGEIAQWSRAHAKFLLDTEVGYFRSIRGERECSAVIETLGHLMQEVENAPADRIFLRVGWGSGWRTMTGDLLPDGPDRKRLLPKSGVFGPKTRKVIVASPARRAPAIGVFGWVSLNPASSEEVRQLAEQATPAVQLKPIDLVQSLPVLRSSIPGDQFIQGLGGLRISDWGRLNDLYQRAQQGQEHEARLQALADKIVEIWGKDRKRRAEARQKFSALARYWK